MKESSRRRENRSVERPEFGSQELSWSFSGPGFFLCCPCWLHFCCSTSGPPPSYILQPSNSLCSLLPHDEYWIYSKRIVTPQGVASGAVEVKGGTIVSVIEGVQAGELPQGNVVDYGDAVVMPGLIDVHAHLDEPGREEWEGFSSGTKAAAAGGITTLIDMPLNSVPSTVSEEALRLKVDAAPHKIYVDVGFWGGLVPENAFNKTALEGLLNAGVLGLKSFMCPSGINDFPMTNKTHIKEALQTLAKYKRPLLVHAELQLDPDSPLELKDSLDSPRSYMTYLKTRPPSMEEAAVKELLDVAEDTRLGGTAEGAHLHVVHLSDAKASLDLIKEAKSRGASLTVETCPHYLAFSAEEIKDGDTRYKCAPPIRNAANKEKLWKALKEDHIDMLSSDHSPSAPELKLFNEGDFLRAWGGISSLQFVLPATWSYGRQYGITLNQLASWWSERPAKLAGQELKGAILSGNHADIVVWEPDADFELDENHSVYHRHRNISAYLGKRLSGKVLATFVRGNLVYSEGKHAPSACGVPILAK
ncbi:allantoinase-like [Aristolochia californica]|uniref:allantoinase-like n=1 Tax=Aristolochia californica TaxID=171875 RepID=UPI0035E2E59B